MPTYDYECDACGHRFEEFQSMKDEPLKKCPECKKKKLRRLIGTGAAILFKGSGFYQTDYRSESYKSAAKADEKPSTNGTSGTAAAANTTESSAKTGGEAKAKGSAPAKKTKT
jgi:putative FmdB family regulatory protein